MDAVESPEQFGIVGRAFGDFQSMLSDFPIEKLHDTIPYFHDTVRRMDNFEASVARDVAHRAECAAAEIAFVRARRDAMGAIVRMIDDGTLPLRVTHNDTKCNNVMVDDVTGEALSPSTFLSKVRLDMELFTAFTEGFVSRTARGLVGAELDNLVLGALVMTFEVGLRFLTDYLDGDVYFRIESPDHNLARAKCQFKLLSDMEAHRAEMEAVARRLVNKFL